MNFGPAPAGWHANTAERTIVWTTTTRDITSTMRDLADLVDASPGLMLYTLITTPIETANDPEAWVMQATLSTLWEPS